MDYKKYSLEQLENWMHDCMSSGEATPQEIYDTIRGVVEENYYTYKDQVSKAYELLVFLNGNGHTLKDVIREKQQSEPFMPPLEHSTDFMIADESGVEDKVIRWQLPVEVDAASEECYVMFPDDLLQAANLAEGDQIEWIDNGNGTFTLHKVSEPLRIDEC